GRPRRLMQTIVVHVADDADDFVPRAGGVLADALSESRGRNPPELPRQVFRDDRDRLALIEIRPGQVTPGNLPDAKRLKEARRHELEPSNRRKLALPVGLALDDEHVVAVE